MDPTHDRGPPNCLTPPLLIFGVSGGCLINAWGLRIFGGPNAKSTPEDPAADIFHEHNDP